MTEAPSPRRSNAERSSTTRNRILRAAVASLIEDGYAATSITAIQIRAGVSRGALLHQYSNKVDLLVDAVRHIADEQTASLVVQVTPGASSPSEAEASSTLHWFDDLWRHFTAPVFGAVLELWVAARTDPSLRETLLPYERQLGRTLRDLALPDSGQTHPRFNEVFELTLTYFRGLALTDILGGREHLDYLLSSWRRAVAGMLGVEGS